jgi:hypothetical protein
VAKKIAEKLLTWAQQSPTSYKTGVRLMADLSVSEGALGIQSTFRRFSDDSRKMNL